MVMKFIKDFQSNNRWFRFEVYHDQMPSIIFYPLKVASNIWNESDPTELLKKSNPFQTLHEVKKIFYEYLSTHRPPQFKIEVSNDEERRINVYSKMISKIKNYEHQIVGHTIYVFEIK